MASRTLSKSKYLAGLRCPLLLWTLANDAASLPPVSPATQHRFDEGNTVGHFARKLFPDGIDVPTDNFIGNIRMTGKLIQERKPIFEAGILAGRLYSRADILNPAENNAWDIYEVKSSTSVKEANIHDVAFQKRVYQQAGIKINRCWLIHIDTSYVKYGEVDPTGLFRIEDISGVVEDATIGMEERISNMLAIIDSKVRPEQTLGDCCILPWECDLKPACWEALPENHIFELNGSLAKKTCYYQQGIIGIKDIDDEADLTRKQAIQKECVVTGTGYSDQAELCRFLSNVTYPAYYLEIETMRSAIPIYDGTRPYQPVPFQFSVHSVNQPGSLPAHHSFLADGDRDPRPQFAEKLSQSIGHEGSIIVCDSRSKAGILGEMASAFPRYQKWVGSITKRMVDLLSPFENFFYYHASQKNEVSLGSVITAIRLEGGQSIVPPPQNQSSVTFSSMRSNTVTAEEKEAIRQNLKTGCKRKTLAMIEIVDRLKDMCKNNFQPAPGDSPDSSI